MAFFAICAPDGGHLFATMLLEVSLGDGTVAASSSTDTFLCSISVQERVQSAIVHVAAVHYLRTQLAAAAAASNTPSTDGKKRPHDAEALSDATHLLSSAAVNRKNVLTIERLEAALAALSGVSESGRSGQTWRGAGLFFASKWLEADKSLSEYVGSNDKSKVKVVFRPGDDCAPQPAPQTASAASATASSEPALVVTHGAASSLPESHAPGAAQVEESGVSLSAYFKRQRGESTCPGEDDYQGDGAAADDDEDLPQLSARQADMLVASREVRAALRDPRLQETLRHVDSAPTREGALRRLETALADTDFEQFTRTALREIRATGHDEPPPV